jgi:hypothetical protein
MSETLCCLGWRIIARGLGQVYVGVQYLSLPFHESSDKVGA